MILTKKIKFNKRKNIPATRAINISFLLINSPYFIVCNIIKKRLKSPQDADSALRLDLKIRPNMIRSSVPFQVLQCTPRFPRKRPQSKTINDTLSC